MVADLTAIAFNAEGFMTNPNEWTKEIAEVLAKQEDIETLTPNTGRSSISVARLACPRVNPQPCARSPQARAFPQKDLFALFPKGPAKKVAKIAGLGKPEGCV